LLSNEQVHATTNDLVPAAKENLSAESDEYVSIDTLENIQNLIEMVFLDDLWN